MASKTTRFKLLQAGFTLFELMVTMGISALVLAAILSYFLSSNRSFAFLTSHVFLEQRNQFTMDLLSQQVRQVRHLSAYTSNALTFQDYDSNSLTFAYDPSARTFSRIKSGRTNILLTACTGLRFQLFSDAVQSNALDVTSTISNAAQCKVVGVSWTCTQTNQGILNSEQLQSGKVLIRNTNAH